MYINKSMYVYVYIYIYTPVCKFVVASPLFCSPF